MLKLCPICNQALKDNDMVVVLLMGKFKLKGDSYDLECAAQTIASHVFCVEKKEA